VTHIKESLAEKDPNYKLQKRKSFVRPLYLCSFITTTLFFFVSVFFSFWDKFFSFISTNNFIKERKEQNPSSQGVYKRKHPTNQEREKREQNWR
jgi:hypothetical protein